MAEALKLSLLVVGRIFQLQSGDITTLYSSQHRLVLPIVVSSPQTNKLICASASHTTAMVSGFWPHEPPVLLHSARGSSLRAILGRQRCIVKARLTMSMAGADFRSNPGSISTRLLHLKARAT